MVKRNEGGGYKSSFAHFGLLMLRASTCLEDAGRFRGRHVETIIFPYTRRGVGKISSFHVGESRTINLLLHYIPWRKSHRTVMSTDFMYAPGGT